MNKTYNRLIAIRSFTIGVFALYTAFRPMNNLDELWIFNYGLNLAKGGLPYKDVGFCVTPFALQFLASVLKIFGQELYVYRCLSVGIYSAVYLTISKDLESKCNGKLKPQLLVSLYFAYMFEVLNYEYNILNSLFLLQIIRLETREEKKVFHYIMVGACIGGIIATKQSTGVVIMIASIVQIVINKEKLEYVAYKFFGFTISIILLIVYLMQNNILKDMLNYTVFGINGFVDNFNFDIFASSFLIYGVILIPLLIYVMIGCIYYFINYMTNKKIYIQDIKKRTTFLYGAAGLCIVIPLFDFTHFMIGLMPFLTYASADFFALDKSCFSRRVRIILMGLWLGVFLGMFLVQCANYNSYENWVFSKLNHCRYILVPAEYEERINLLCDVIEEYTEQGNEVYILDTSACCYFIPMDEWHSDYDMLIKGNIGISSIEELVEDICNDKNIIFIPKEGSVVNYQTPDNLRELLFKNGMAVINECFQYDIMEYRGYQ